jgi:hypothetical protein
MTRSPQWSFTVDETDRKRVRKKLERASGKSLYVRMQKANKAVGDIVAQRARQAAPVGPTGNLKKSIAARVAKDRWTKKATTTVYVSPGVRKGPHRHLVIQGHRIVTPRTKRYLGRRTRANPFMDRARRGIEGKARDLVLSEWRQLLR